MAGAFRNNPCYKMKLLAAMLDWASSGLLTTARQRRAVMLGAPPVGLSLHALRANKGLTVDNIATVGVLPSRHFWVPLLVFLKQDLQKCVG